MKPRKIWGQFQTPWFWGVRAAGGCCGPPGGLNSGVSWARWRSGALWAYRRRLSVAKLAGVFSPPTFLLLLGQAVVVGPAACALGRPAANLLQSPASKGFPPNNAQFETNNFRRIGLGIA